MNYEKEYDTMSESVKKLIDDTETKMFKLINDSYRKLLKFFLVDIFSSYSRLSNQTVQKTYYLNQQYQQV